MRTTMGTAVPADLGGRLRELRKRAGFSPEKAGLETGLSARVIGDFERGYRVPRLAYLRVLAALYGVTVADLVGVEVTETTSPQPNTSTPSTSAAPSTIFRRWAPVSVTN